MKRIQTAGGVTMVAALMALALMAPALGHEATLTIHGEKNEDTGKIEGAAILSPAHPNAKVTIILRKQKAGGGFTEVARKKVGEFIYEGSYYATFADVAGNKTCKMKAIFKRENHTTVTAVSETFAC